MYLFSLRLYAHEVDKSCEMNEALGNGIAIFQGLSNIALNCEYVLFHSSQLYLYRDHFSGSLQACCNVP